ncbi:hypothetical protein A7981_01140 [Methylovorus sp. MM2]|uniref:GspH/FimT family pseudopilin n=1 Tax=Methylovorus sp. MM2 TaxID=1848038 RepID=UPI0007E1567B|nr:GspH/FimT family pseudopilin [Methylovorus sp. MM2]OAM52124.1 hypothetical protein A7981_01140 [Methylovorus sp. MM2]
MKIASSGFSLIELMVGLAILVILLIAGVPALSSWMQNAQIRNEAESIQNALQLARAEAVRRNTVVRFQLVNTIESGCATSTQGTSWVVSLDNATGACDAIPMQDGVAGDQTPRIIQRNAATSAAPNVVVNATLATISFNGFGRQESVSVSGGGVTPSPPEQVNIVITNPTGGACASSTNQNNPMRCLNIVVSPGGNVRMCDPALNLLDTQGCG